MAQFNIDRQLAQDPAGTLHAGVDLALEKNVVVVVNEKAERLDLFSFPRQAWLPLPLGQIEYGMLRQDLGCTRPIPRIPAGHSG
jgi:hypothetical protein